jgi:hypothetical protein
VNEKSTGQRPQSFGRTHQIPRVSKPIRQVDWRYAVSSAQSLPERDPIGAGRYVIDENNTYVKSQNGWITLKQWNDGE